MLHFFMCEMFPHVNSGLHNFSQETISDFRETKQSYKIYIRMFDRIQLKNKS